MASYSGNYSQFKDSYYKSMNGVGISNYGHEFSNWPSFVQQVEVCEICGDNTHPTDVCPYEPEYESYHYWGNASPQPDLSYPFSSPLTPRQDEQSLEDMFKEYSSANQRLHQDILQYKENMEQHFKDINSNLQSIETLTSKMNDTLNRMLEEEEFPVLLSCDEQETLKDVTLMSVEANEHAMNEYFAIDGLTPCIYEYWSDHEESEGELEVSQSEPEIIMAQTYEEEAEKDIEVTLTRPEDLQQESKDDQSFVLVNPPTLPYIFDDFDMEVDVKERSKTFCTADTFVLDDLDITDSYVLEVPDKLPFLNSCGGIGGSGGGGVPAVVTTPPVAAIGAATGPGAISPWPVMAAVPVQWRWDIIDQQRGSLLCVN
ncbi:hypothetical protein Sjap_018055 [Stephania japonica]|uniref:Uncharacterized protein n=1 Tax=Stephania japonica TaxID=461633 RepID=A0AAP0I7E4_9MAGN